MEITCFGTVTVIYKRQHYQHQIGQLLITVSKLLTQSCQDCNAQRSKTNNDLNSSNAKTSDWLNVSLETYTNIFIVLSSA